MAGRYAPAPSSSPLDVIVVGAGLAGLTAARSVMDHGARVLVLEARDRVGGRTYSHRTPYGDTIDLGAQWIGPTQDRAAALAAEVGVRTFNQFTDGRKILSIGGHISSYSSAIPSLPLLSLLSLNRVIKNLEKMCKQVSLEAPYTSPRAAEWDVITVESWKLASVATRATRSIVDIAVRAVFAAEPADVSFLYFLFYLHSGGGLLRLTQSTDGAQQTRFVGGSQSLCIHLADRLEDRVYRNAPVRAIAQAGDRVRVRSDLGAFEARCVIVALPPTLAGRIDYDPPMPAARDQLLQRVPMGSVIKCVAFYERPFWRDEGFSGEAISDTGPVTLVFDDCPERGSPGALLAFVLGAQARRWSRQSAEDRRRAVIDELVRIFGPKAGKPDYYVDKDWASEPWSGGCYTGLFPPGVLTAYGDVLRAPVGRIHWAGTETALVWNGYMDGAIESGQRAAQEVLARLDTDS